VGIERRRPCVQGVESGGPGREQAAIGVRSRLVRIAIVVVRLLRRKQELLARVVHGVCTQAYAGMSADLPAPQG